ncbi:GIY-YIG nuclease family protein [Haematomicrobium sanguinis]|uniref:GIY-YIG nuclease family protein n=1 Tax=Haematomicrobium sanguinis TaxID=479106 RepID=UPI00047D2BD9|nr:GIY-YIG nuclease family protein [Haematomicrobium sanguinis]
MENDFYVYELIDPKAYRETVDKLLSLFYVGKGKANRLDQHEKDVRKTLRQEEEHLEQYGSKWSRIREILERGESVRSVHLSSGYASEDDANKAETLAIDPVNGLPRAARGPELTNAIPGHEAGFLDLGEHFKFVFAEDVVVSDSVQSGTRRAKDGKRTWSSW